MLHICCAHSTSVRLSVITPSRSPIHDDAFVHRDMTRPGRAEGLAGRCGQAQLRYPSIPRLLPGCDGGAVQHGSDTVCRHPFGIMNAGKAFHAMRCGPGIQETATMDGLMLPSSSLVFRLI